MIEGSLANLDGSMFDMYQTYFGNGGPTTYAMATLDAGFAAKEQARDTRDYKSVWVNFSAVTAGGTIELRIETVNATTLKPSGSLYDAAATKTFTPVVGWQNVQFASLPTAGRTVGTIYAIVLVTTVAGTTQTLRAYTSLNTPGRQPINVQTGASVTTRTNFADVTAQALPHITVVMEDSVEERVGFPFAVQTVYTVFGTKGIANKLTLTAPLVVDGIRGYSTIGNTVNLTGDLRFFILNASGTIVSGTDVTLIRKMWSADFAARGFIAPFTSAITLQPGIYYVCARNTDAASISSAAYNIGVANMRSSNVCGSGYFSSSTVDITASPPVWTDDNTSLSFLFPSISGLGSNVILNNYIHQHITEEIYY